VRGTTLRTLPPPGGVTVTERKRRHNPFGINGQHEIRQVKFYDYEFVKCRLTSKHPQYRLNQQYLFYLLNDANIRQLSRGIFHKMNVSNPRIRYTAAEYLDAMSKKLLESNLTMSTIFSTLRNMEQYWRKLKLLMLNLRIYFIHL